jgi:hypothetical protein
MTALLGYKRDADAARRVDRIGRLVGGARAAAGGLTVARLRSPEDARGRAAGGVARCRSHRRASAERS